GTYGSSRPETWEWTRAGTLRHGDALALSGRGARGRWRPDQRSARGRREVDRLCGWQGLQPVPTPWAERGWQGHHVAAGLASLRPQGATGPRSPGPGRNPQTATGEPTSRC